MPVFTYVPGLNDESARDRAFFLLKKYTSATSLMQAIQLYESFVNDFEREIRKIEKAPAKGIAVGANFEQDLLYFLEYLPPMQRAMPLLANQATRMEAFKLLRDAIAFDAFIWGRRYQEANAGEPGNLLYRLGYRWSSAESVDVFGKAAHSGTLMSLLFGTLNKAGRVFFGKGQNARAVMRWTFESIFYDDVPENFIPKISFPANLPSCPAKNENSDGQVWSGRTIPVTGIWEPWPIDPSIGPRCPNYYLAGDIASQYQIEGTDALEDVRWRLIWKDSRYADGTIPYEEQEYFAPTPPVVRNRRMLTARPGDICPKAGEWFSHHLNRRVNVQAGEPMPGPEISKTGAVIWYLELND